MLFRSCHVIISDEEIASPVIDRPEAAIILNLPSLDKYEPLMKENGIMILNKTLIPREVKRGDVRVLQIDAHGVAQKLGSEKVVNMILLGAYVEVEKPVLLESIKEALKKYLTGRKAELLKVNIKAIEEGSKIAKDFLGG